MKKSLKKQIIIYLFCVIILSAILVIYSIYDYTFGFDFTQDLYPAIGGSYLMELKDIVKFSIKSSIKTVLVIFTPIYLIICIIIGKSI